MMRRMGAKMRRWLNNESASVCVRSGTEGEIIRCVIRGVWDARLERDTASVLRTCLTAHPTGFLIDLSGLHDPAAESARSWTTVRTAAAGMDPPVNVALCIPAEQLLAHSLQQGVRQFLPVYATAEQANVALTYRALSSERLLLRQPAGPDASGVARKLIAEACRGYQKPRLLRPAQLVVTELVANAVQHARTAITVTVAPRAGGLRLTVSDGDPHPPRPASPSSSSPLVDEAGHGLQLVQAAAAAWGAIATQDGKTIWAIVNHARPNRNPSPTRA
jgi:anti-sigma regulatory factor (Ser/Thr protein kinase)